MNIIGSVISMTYVDTNDDDENFSPRNVALMTTFFGFLAVSYIQFRNYRNFQRLSDARIKELTFLNSELRSHCSDKEKEIKNSDQKFKDLTLSNNKPCSHCSDKEKEIINSDQKSKELANEFKKLLTQTILVSNAQHSNLSK